MMLQKILVHEFIQSIFLVVARIDVDVGPRVALEALVILPVIDRVIAVEEQHFLLSAVIVEAHYLDLLWVADLEVLQRADPGQIAVYEAVMIL